jgi:hypothetical protein
MWGKADFHWAFISSRASNAQSNLKIQHTHISYRLANPISIVGYQYTSLIIKLEIRCPTEGRLHLQ